MLDSRAHTDDLIRDLQLTLLDSASESRPGVVELAGQLQRANEEFHEPRRQMYNQTVSAARHGNARGHCTFLCTGLTRSRDLLARRA